MVRPGVIETWRSLRYICSPGGSKSSKCRGSRLIRSKATSFRRFRLPRKVRRHLSPGRTYEKDPPKGSFSYVLGRTTPARRPGRARSSGRCFESLKRTKRGGADQESESVLWCVAAQNSRYSGSSPPPSTNSQRRHDSVSAVAVVAGGGLERLFRGPSGPKQSGSSEWVSLEAKRTKLATRVTEPTTPARFTGGLERHSDVALPRASRGREHLVDLELKAHKYT